MKIQIKLDDVLYIENYKSIDEINEEFYNNVIYINCDSHGLTNIEFINRFPNLKTLIASNNLLSDIPDHYNLEVLDVNTNKIKRLGFYPKLLKLFAFNNLIKHYNVPFTVYQLDLSNNKLRYLNLNKKQIFTLFNINYNNLMNNNRSSKININDYLYTIHE
jgi:hypothetical protein